MSYQVIARKWRPQSFNEVVFQEHVSKTIRNSISSGRISHAYLFSGPRGVGKTTMARILAKALNCIHGPTPDPCGVCANCVEIKNGSAFDVIEIDGASNRGIDDVRDLREKVNFAPVKSHYKVYIIDEVHMLTKEAFNALLKTLEEPPPHAVFVFATTEIHQIPETILSRCQKYFFKKIPPEHVVAHLRSIVEGEGYKISDKALYPIARAGEGSMRDAQSLLEQVISFSGAKGSLEISEDDALAILGIVPVESFITQMTNVINLDASGAMAETERIASMGVDIQRYVAGLIDVIRAMRLIRNGVSAAEMLALSASETEGLARITSQFEDEDLSVIFRIADSLSSELRYSGNERINLEMALLDMIAAKKGPSIAKIIRRLEGLPEDRVQKKKIEQPVKTGIEKIGTGKTETGEKNNPLPADFSVLWQEYLDLNNEKSLYVVLKESRIRFEGDTLTILFHDTSDNSYFARSLDLNARTAIAEYFSGKTGRKITVNVESEKTEVSGNDLKRRLQSDLNSAQEDDSPLPEEDMRKNPDIEGFEKPNPAVEKVKKFFHGEIIDKEKKDA